jgi:hypothetical protein
VSSISTTTDRRTITGASGFTAAEVALLVIWGELHGLELAIRPAGAEFADEVAFVAYGEGDAAWTISRANGHLWLEFFADRLRQEFKGWRVEVGSVEEALARIFAEIERPRDIDLRHHDA